ncbi:MAG: YlxR family protein [Bacilli bacterium]|nr:YlxR family protein [Bacilli bacterium]
MKQKKIPLRSCTITREKLPKQELLRIIRNPEGKVEIDLTGKKNGRGAYIKKDLDVLMKAKKNHGLARSLEVEIPESIYQEIEDIIKQEIQ